MPYGGSKYHLEFLKIYRRLKTNVLLSLLHNDTVSDTTSYHLRSRSLLSDFRSVPRYIVMYRSVNSPYQIPCTSWGNSTGY